MTTNDKVEEYFEEIPLIESVSSIAVLKVINRLFVWSS